MALRFDWRSRGAWSEANSDKRPGQRGLEIEHALEPVMIGKHPPHRVCGEQRIQQTDGFRDVQIAHPLK